MIRTTLLLLGAATLMACDKPGEDSRPTELRLSENNITVSGLSAGGYMATQLHVAMSERITGVGLIAAGPYWCSKGDIHRALSTCLAGGDLDIDSLTHHARDEAAAGRLATLNHLRKARVWIFHGLKDSVVTADVAYAAVDFYEQLGDGSAVAYIDGIEAAHGFPTLSTGAECATMESPFLNACDYDAAGEMLTHITGQTAQPDAAANGEYRVIDQSDFAEAGLADEAVLYVPTQCAGAKQCALHVALHGCQQSTRFVERSFIEQAGYNRWADAMDLVVLYPQAATSSVNPLGCWDWWGYTGADFENRNGAQIVALTTLIDRLTNPAP